MYDTATITEVEDLIKSSTTEVECTVSLDSSALSGTHHELEGKNFINL